MGFVAWELEGCNPPVRFLFVEWPLMALWDEIGFSRKNSFPGLEKVIFRTCLDCFQSTQDQYVDIFGHWLNKNWAALLSKPRKPHIDSAERLRKTTPLRDPNPRSSSATTDALTIVLQDPCLWRILQSYSLWAGCKRAGVWRGPRLRPKKNATWFFFSGVSFVRLRDKFSGSEKLFFCIPPWTMKWNEPFLRALRKKLFFRNLKKCFRNCVCETHWQARLCKNTIFQALIFCFRTTRVKSANSTSLPRLSSLQIA